MGLSNCTIIGNNISSNNKTGLTIVGNYNVIKDNIVNFNQEFGVWLIQGSRNNTLINNTANSNLGDGFRIQDSYNTELINNTADSNGGFGIYLQSFTNNTYHNILYHNNLINNSHDSYNAYDASSNKWDNGYPDGGNYWSDHNSADNFKGSNQDQPGSAGISDTSYKIPGDNSVDNYPLMTPLILQTFHQLRDL